MDTIFKQQGKVTNVILRMKLPRGKTRECTLHDELLVPDLAYNLLSVTSAAKRNNVTTFTESKCKIRDAKSRVVASGHREGSLYYLNYDEVTQHHLIRNHDNLKGTTWDRRFGHYGHTKFAATCHGEWSHFSQELDFCDSCTESLTTAPNSGL